MISQLMFNTLLIPGEELRLWMSKPPISNPGGFYHENSPTVEFHCNLLDILNKLRYTLGVRCIRLPAANTTPSGTVLTGRAIELLELVPANLQKRQALVQLDNHTSAHLKTLFCTFDCYEDRYIYKYNISTTDWSDMLLIAILE